MSTIRKRMLPPGWYPVNADRAGRVLRDWSRSHKPICTNAVACVVPHAGWEFSGDLAFSAIGTLERSIDTVVVAGGHLPPVAAVLVSPADLFETPFGHLEADREIAEALAAHFDVDADNRVDNTVEIQLPIVKYLFPGAKLVYLRLSPTSEAGDVGIRLQAISAELGRKIAVIGSTDLTHYGPAYGFTPAGSGKEAEEWVRERNDKQFLNFLLKMDFESALDHARSNGSACSAGAAAAAAAFAKASGVKAGRLVGRRMSSDLYAGESFVGYGALTYAP